MNVEALKKVRKLFAINGVPRNVQRHNCHQWVRSIRYLNELPKTKIVKIEEVK